MYHRKIKYAIATGLGIGYSTYVPGTVGSLAALFIYVIVPVGDLSWLIICIVTLFIGIWVSGSVEKDKGKDPAIVVIDEFVGQWIAILFLPRLLWIYVAGFVLFRILDIMKPFPADKIEKTEGGIGIMLDDVIAGIYTNILLQTILIIIS